MRSYKEQRKFSKINEALENDITWGDSWAGRIFSSIFRNAKLATDLKIVIPSLLRQLDDAINNTVMEEIAKDENVANTIKEVKKAGITDGIIDTIKNKPNNLSDVLTALVKDNGEEEMSTVMNSLPDDIQEIIKALVEYDDSIEKEKKNDSKDSIYPTIVKNLKALHAILSDDFTSVIKYTKLNPNPQTPANAAPTPSAPNNTNNNNNNNNNVNTSAGRWKEKQREPMLENVILFSDYISKNEKITFSADDKNSIEAHGKIKKSVEMLKNKKDKGISVDADLIADFLNNVMNSESKISLKKLYSMIYKYNSNQQSGVTDFDPLIKERIEFLENNNNLIIIAEKIARFYRRTIQLEENNLYDSMSDLGIHFKTFNQTMSKIMHFEKSINEKPEVVALPETQTQKITEGVLSNLFQKDKSNNKVSISGIGNKVTIIYNGTDFNTSQEMDKLSKQNLLDITDKTKQLELTDEKISQYVEKSEIDVIEIVRIFNKANRIIVKNNIPSSRTNGKVNVNRSNNWTKLDGGGINPSEPGAGPFRNAKLFQAWNDGVLKIIKENSEILKKARSIDDNGNKITAKYPITKFMTDSLDDSKMFFKGNQSKYLHQHFGINYNSLSETETKQSHPITPKQEVITQKVTPIKANGDFTWGGTLGEFKPNSIYKMNMKCTVDGIKLNTTFFLVGMGLFGDKILYKMSKSDEVIKKYANGYESNMENDKISHIFFNSKASTRDRKNMNENKKVMLTDTQTSRLLASNTIDVVIESITSVRVLSENNKVCYRKKTDYSIFNDEDLPKEYVMILKDVLLDNEKTNESIILFSDFIKNK